MSRNLCRTTCNRCEGLVVLVEKPRPLTMGDAGIYYQEFATITVAYAECVPCGAKYLAWVEDVLKPGESGIEPRPRIFDLSYRSTFNDEPGEVDLPHPRVAIDEWKAHILSVLVGKLEHQVTFEEIDGANAVGLVAAMPATVLIRKVGDRFYLAAEHWREMTGRRELGNFASLEDAKLAAKHYADRGWFDL